jgi:hypothetical protein
MHFGDLGRYRIAEVGEFEDRADFDLIPTARPDDSMTAL